MGEARDAGLRREVGAWGLGAGVFNTTVGGGIFAVPAALAKEIGAAAPLAYLACAVATGGVVLCFAAAGSRTPTSGGPYGYAEAAFGPFTGFLTGLLVWLGAVLAAGGLAAAIADGLAAFLPAVAGTGPRTLVIVALFATFGAINLRGVSSGTGLVWLTTVLKLGPILLLLVVGAAHLRMANLLPDGHAALGGGFGRAMLLAIFTFQGMETALGVSGEVKDPARNVPRGLIGAMAGVTLLYIAIQLVVQGVLGPALAASVEPLADAARAAWAPAGVVLLAGAMFSRAGYLAGDTLSAPRILFAFARDGFLPAPLARVLPATGAPAVAIITHVTIAAALATTGGFVQLASLAALASIGVYVVGCLAAVVLQRRGVTHAGPPLVLRHLWLAAAIGVLGMAWITVNAKPEELLGLGATLAAGALVYLLTRRRRAVDPARKV